jgi:serine/threonine protein kinase
MYMAPEIIRGSHCTSTLEPSALVVLGKAYNCKVDVWSAACLVYSLCTLRMPFQGIEALSTLPLNLVSVLFVNPISTPTLPKFQTQELEHAILNKEPPSLSNEYSLELRNLLRLMHRKKPRDRVSSCGVSDLIPAQLRRHFMSNDDKEPGRAMLLTVLTYSSRSPPVSCARPYTSMGLSTPKSPERLPLPETAFIPVRIEVKQHVTGRRGSRGSNGRRLSGAKSLSPTLAPLSPTLAPLSPTLSPEQMAMLRLNQRLSK